MKVSQAQVLDVPAAQPQSTGHQDDGIVALPFRTGAVYGSDELGQFLFGPDGWDGSLLSGLDHGHLRCKVGPDDAFPKKEPEEGTKSSRCSARPSWRRSLRG